jgi:hypothetical protein
LSPGGNVLQSGGGIYSTTFKANPGDELTQYITLKFSKPGKYLINVKCIYYPENHKNNFKELNYAKSITVSGSKSSSMPIFGIFDLSHQ